MTPSNLSKSWRNFQLKKRQCGDLPLLVSENSIIKYESGREGDRCRIGFSPRKSAFSLYVLHCDDSENKLLSQLGKIKMGQGSCIYFKKLADLNLDVLDKLITDSLHQTKKLYG